MQTAVFFLIGCLTGTALAQTPLNQQVISSPATSPVQVPTVGPGNLMITNSTGGTFPLSQLDAQLATLRADVEHALPLLSAVVSQAPNTSLTRGQELANAASNLLARALGRNTNENSGLPAGGLSPRMTNFAGFLRGLISTNTGGGGGVSFDPNTINQLITLQNELKPVLATLDSLNVASVGGATNQPPGTINQPGRVFAPTGR
ncbi:MAG TPA: hypothetical protein VL361_28940 [Candidatus Limnocylindrales bacterium]|jgi:hypothetical protein|nr:hypothetical protein [Candidatus Limnocylindrales bacterium]